MKPVVAVLAILILSASPVCCATGGEDVFGVWLTEGGLSKLEIAPCGDKACARVVWMKHATYQNSKDGPLGTEKVDRLNPDPALRGRPILGLQVMEGLTRDGEWWKGGSCYDPQTGKQYQCKMHLESPHELKLRGFIGISLLGRTYTLTRDLTAPVRNARNSVNNGDLSPDAQTSGR